jgi:radical SAM superfamily enzyme YgiQ (UPF0313 family)
MAKVVLIDPPFEGSFSRPPLGTLTLAAYLKARGHEVALLNIIDRDTDGQRLRREIESGADVAGISSVIGPQLAGSLEAARIVRDANPAIPIVWGGVHPTLAPETTLRHDLCDAVCLGEGELSLPALVEAHMRGQSFDHIPGVGFKRDGRQVWTAKSPTLVDMDAVPDMPYELVDITRYRLEPGSAFYGLTRDDILMSVETSRGCAYHCTYCVNAAKRERFRQRSPETVIRLLAPIVEELGVRSITINDDNFFVNKRRAEAILRAIAAKDWDLEIFVAVRSDYLARQNDADFELMKAAGIKMFGIGVESGSNRMLGELQKKEPIEATYEAVQRMRKHGFTAWVHFLYGFPGETREDLIATYTAMRKVLSLNEHVQVNLNRLIPNPSTPSYRQCLELGWVPPETIEGWANVCKAIQAARPVHMDAALEQWWSDNLSAVRWPTRNLPHIA